MNIAKRIYELMKRKDWTAYELSKQTGISTNTIYAWENNSMPTLTNVIKVCEAMNITLEQFFCGEANYRLSDDEQKFLNECINYRIAVNKPPVIKQRRLK